MHHPRGGADLFVGIGGDVIHDEIDQPPFFLQAPEKLYHLGLGELFRGGTGYGRFRRCGGSLHRYGRLDRRFAPKEADQLQQRGDTEEGDGGDVQLRKEFGLGGKQFGKKEEDGDQGQSGQGKEDTHGFSPENGMQWDKKRFKTKSFFQQG
jgi:hypothetical protein